MFVHQTCNRLKTILLNFRFTFASEHSKIYVQSDSSFICPSKQPHTHTHTPPPKQTQKQTHVRHLRLRNLYVLHISVTFLSSPRTANETFCLTYYHLLNDMILIQTRARIQFFNKYNEQSDWQYVVTLVLEYNWAFQWKWKRISPNEYCVSSISIIQTRARN